MLKRFLMAVTTAWVAIAGSASATPIVYNIYNNFNGGHVSDHQNAASPTFALAGATDITGVAIYAQSFSSVFPANSGTVYFLNTTTNQTTNFLVSLEGTWHQYGSFDFDELLSYAGHTTLAAGNYVVSVDSALQSEWANNSESNGVGFLAVAGDPVAVSEPGSIALMALALVGLAGARRRFR